MVKKSKSRKYITFGIVLLILFLIASGIAFFIHNQNKKEAETKTRNFEVEKRERENLKTEIAQLKEQEKELKKQFANTQTLSEKKLTKEKLTSLQNTLFDKKEHWKNSAPTSASSVLKDEKNLDKKKLANSLKRDIKKQLEDLKNGTWEEGDIQSDPAFKFLFVRHYLDEKDCQEIADLLAQVQELHGIKREQERAEIDEKLSNNPKLFYRSPSPGGVSIEWKDMKEFYCFQGKQNGLDFSLMIPKNHPALNNVLFNNGWGVNSEIGNFYLIEGVDNIPMESIPPAYHGSSPKYNSSKDKFVGLKDEISVNYFQERERERTLI
ncbi:hypothetical protein [endosymbiont GvMRE of Glomus versiforme]|uniref:hypothetical protein n=1 Tax=endosymbiont GvMRE of Glomus versiforme TaxID=2039283 RepID=UPI000EBE6092|nr:hypothetical protein [endosymbiont GvMRE of Glomus versiforme]RHZ37299.1 hypothetical protein GvMRE_I1g61 [endosymbiont GvMRE of Glomus versiforme]